MIDNTVLAYVSGIVDGEGCIRIDKAKGHTSHRQYCYVLVLTVSNTNPWLCQYLKSLFGGCAYPLYHERPRKTCWEWRVSAKKALSVLEQITPYLTIKKPQAKIAINFQRRKKRKCGSPGIRGCLPMSDEKLAVEEAEFIIMRNIKREVSNG